MGDPRGVARRWAEAYDSHDARQIEEVLAEDAVLVGPEGTFEGRRAITDYMMAWARAFGGGYTIDHVTAEADRVVMEMTWRGLHSGTYVTAAGDVPATNRAVEARSSHAVVVDGEVATEIRMYFDVFDFLSQLGLLPGAAAEPVPG